MMLSALLNGIATVQPSQDLAISALSLDSREVTAGSLFVALKGTQQHGLDYAQAVATQGAAAIIWEADANTSAVPLDIPQIEIPQLREHLGTLARRFYGDVSDALTVIGITGTDGKTSVSHFLAQAMTDCSVMGTLGIGTLDKLQTATHTTPDVLSVHKHLAAMAVQGITTVAMEVSSHALDQARVAGVAFDVAVLTNLSRDHLDYHGSVEAYAAAKAKLFDWPSLRGVVLNADDAFGDTLAEKTSERCMNSFDAVKEQRDVIQRSVDANSDRKNAKKVGGCQLHASPKSDNTLNRISYGIGDISDYPAGTLVASNARFSNAGLSATVHFAGEQTTLNAAVLGRFNLSNLLAALGAMLVLDVPLNTAVKALSQVQTVAGRMERVSHGEVLAVVDYAHTPNALETVLKALREHTKNKLICVFGCGGDRDTGKRPLMAKAAETHADVVIVTDDNPRTENPKTIMQDIIAGLAHAEAATIEHDRAAAIALALGQANNGDTVLIAGKGHENEQILATGTIPFSDREHAQKVLQERAA